MQYLLIAAVALLSFANGANDNFKGVATLWGAGRTSYKRALGWATIFTFLGSIAAVLVAGGLAAKFNGSNLVAKDIYTQVPFLSAVILAAAGTVLLASRLGVPISTTHALVGSLVGAGVSAAGLANIHFSALGRGVVLPLLFSPVAARDNMGLDEDRRNRHLVGWWIWLLPPMLVEAFLKCPTKCFLRSLGETGVGNTYADWVCAQSTAYQREGSTRLKGGANGECVTGPLDRKKLKSATWRMTTESKVCAQNLACTLHAVERVPSDNPGTPA
jgi:hypothetical protein